MIEDSDFSEDAEPEMIKSGASFAADDELYSILKDLRKKIAKQLGLPPYVISRIRRSKQWPPPTRFHSKNFRTFPA